MYNILFLPHTTSTLLLFEISRIIFKYACTLSSYWTRPRPWTWPLLLYPFKYIPYTFFHTLAKDGRWGPLHLHLWSEWHPLCLWELPTFEDDGLCRAVQDHPVLYQSFCQDGQVSFWVCRKVLTLSLSTDILCCVVPVILCPLFCTFVFVSLWIHSTIRSMEGWCTSMSIACVTSSSNMISSLPMYMIVSYWR